MAKRSSKTVEQQCRYYEVGNIFVYIDVYKRQIVLIGN